MDDTRVECEKLSRPTKGIDAVDGDERTAVDGRKVPQKGPPGLVNQMSDTNCFRWLPSACAVEGSITDSWASL